MINLTEKAKQKLKEFAENEGLALSVRIKVLGGGCAGFSHDMNFESNPTEFDEVIKFDEISIIIDPISNQYLENATIDYIEQPFGGGFKFLSPDIKGSCGCGSSVEY